MGMKVKRKQRPKVGLALIIKKEGKVLLGKRKNAHGEGTWAFPGGHLEYFEDLETCALRELEEEAGDINIRDLKFATVTNDKFIKENKHYITIFMTSEYISGEVELREPDKCEEWKWYSWEKLPKDLFLAIQNLQKQGYNPFK